MISSETLINLNYFLIEFTCLTGSRELCLDDVSFTTRIFYHEAPRVVGLIISATNRTSHFFTYGRRGFPFWAFGARYATG